MNMTNIFGTVQDPAWLEWLALIMRDTLLPIIVAVAGPAHALGQAEVGHESG